MSKTGDWGDKIILTLHSDGERRHKTWCDNYEDNFCKALCGKCVGSAHCEHYKNKNTDGGYYRKKPDEGERGGCVKPPLPRKFPWREIYRPASYGDRLLHEIVLVKSAPYTFKICEVTSEDFYFFTVEYDGREHRYDKRVAYRNNAVYILSETDKTESGWIL